MAIFGKNAPNPRSKFRYTKQLRAAPEDGQPWPSSAESGHLRKNPGETAKKGIPRPFLTSQQNLQSANRKLNLLFCPSPTPPASNLKICNRESKISYSALPRPYISFLE
jgi:hypothetical protein